MKVENAETCGGESKRRILEFLDKHPDEVFSADELANIFDLPENKRIHPKIMARFLGGDRYRLKHAIDRRVLFGCPKALKKLAEIWEVEYEDK